jgi:hypothetical protein
MYIISYISKSQKGMSALLDQAAIEQKKLDKAIWI